MKQDLHDVVNRAVDEVLLCVNCWERDHPDELYPEEADVAVCWPGCEA